MGFDEWSNGKKLAVVLIIVLAITAIIGVATVLIVGEIGKTTETITNRITENVNNNNINDNSTKNRSSSRGNSSRGNMVEVAKGDYKIKIETGNSWASYITTDGQYSQSEASGSQTIDLGTVTSFSSITINQKGSGKTKVSIVDANDTVVTKKTNSIDYGSISILLRVK